MAKEKKYYLATTDYFDEAGGQHTNIVLVCASSKENAEIAVRNNAIEKGLTEEIITSVIVHETIIGDESSKMIADMLLEGFGMVKS